MPPSRADCRARTASLRLKALLPRRPIARASSCTAFTEVATNLCFRDISVNWDQTVFHSVKLAHRCCTARAQWRPKNRVFPRTTDRDGVHMEEAQTSDLLRPCCKNTANIAIFSPAVPSAFAAFRRRSWEKLAQFWRKDRGELAHGKISSLNQCASNASPRPCRCSHRRHLHDGSGLYLHVRGKSKSWSFRYSGRRISPPGGSARHIEVNKRKRSCGSAVINWHATRTHSHDVLRRLCRRRSSRSATASPNSTDTSANRRGAVSRRKPWAAP